MVSDSGKLGTFVFLIDSDKIEKLFRDIYIPSSGWIYVEDMNGKTILEIPSENGEFQIVPQELIEDEKMVFQTKLKKEKVCVIRQKSKKTGLVYTAVLPKRCLSGEIRQKQTQFTGLMVLVGITGVAAILLISYLRGKNLHSIMNQNRKLNEEMKRQEPVVRGLLIEKMLKSDKAVIPQVIRNLNKYGVSFSEMQRFVVIMFEFSKDEGEEIADIQKLELCKLMLNEKLSVIFGKKFHVCNPEVSKSVMIFEISAEVGDIRVYYQETFEKLTAYFLEEYEVILDITVGSACNSVNEVHKSYDEIQEIAGYQKEQGYHIFYYDDYKGQMFFYYYPMTVEERLMNAVRLGDATVMHDQLKQIYTVNVLERNLSFSMMHFLINEMQCTIFKLLHSVECAEKDKLEAIYNEIERINQEKDLLIRFQMVTEVFKTLCGQAVEQNKSRDEQSVKEIKKYIDLHYSEAGMGLAQTAEEFGYASAYFSRRFKALFGETFVSYVENVRIQHVCEMLETNMTLEKIAEQTGYNSADVMRSAFKKKKGCTPNEWRKLRGTAD